MFTVLESNSMLRTSRFRGTFPTIEAATDYCDKQAARTRSFVSYQVHTGTPKQPGAPCDIIRSGSE